MDQKRLLILRSFRSVNNGGKLTENIFNLLLKDWGFENLNLDEELNKINQKKSFLSKSEREAISEFIILRNILSSKKKQEEEIISFNNSNSNSSEQLIAPISIS